MRKLVLPLLVAGVVALTASQAMAGATNRTAEFSESHGLGTVYTPGVVTASFNEVGGNHYKATDMVETGRHGFQLDSGILKGLVAESPVAADDAYGYTTNANPWAGPFIGPDTDFPITAPAYTEPCPADLYANPCDALTFATDPQTEDNVATWDGMVLDDLYQQVGNNDSSADGLTTRTFYQNLDELFMNGKPANKNVTVTVGTTVVAVPADERFFNIQETLDQDIADYTTDGEIMGIYGKLTQVFQLAGHVSSHTGCASYGAYQESDNGPSLCAAFASNSEATGANAGEANPANGSMGGWAIDQWVVSDVWDWEPAGMAQIDNKWYGTGLAQGYSSWFIDGGITNYNYQYEYLTNHGTIDKSVETTNHMIDP